MMIQRIFLSLSLIAATTVPVFGQTLKVDKAKSKIDFVGKKTDGKHAGGFKEFKSEAKVDMDSPDKSSLMIEIATESLWSDDEKLTVHLKNADFFDIKKYPTIKFESTKVEVADEKVTLTGKLTMLDKTIEIKIPATSAIDDKSLTIKADFKIDRTQWGMSFGKGKIENEVELKTVLMFPR